MAKEFKEHVCATSQTSISRLLVELETGGNIRLEDGKPSDVWYSSCVDLVNSRFVAADFADLGVTGIRVSRVTRIHNRHLRNRFEEKLEAMVNINDLGYKRCASRGAPPTALHPPPWPRTPPPAFFSSSEATAPRARSARALLTLARSPALNPPLASGTLRTPASLPGASRAAQP